MSKFIKRILELEEDNTNLRAKIERMSSRGIEDMQDRITELEAEIATHQWVSVEDDLPVPNDDWDIQIYDTEGVCLLNLSVSYTNDTPKYYNYGDEFTLDEIKLNYTHWKRNTLPEEELKENRNEYKAMDR